MWSLYKLSPEHRQIHEKNVCCVFVYGPEPVVLASCPLLCLSAGATLAMLRQIVLIA